MALKPLKNTLTETFKTIGKYQKGEITQIRTNREWFDRHGGLTPKSILSIVGASFGGKSTELENLKRDIMDKNINPNSDKFVWASFAYEMTNFSTTVRDLKKKLGKTKKEILNSEFTEKERQIVKEYYEEKTDGRFFVNYIPQNPEDFLKDVRVFLEAHLDKELVVLSLDHIALAKSMNGKKKVSVDEIVEGLNELKNEYDNFLVVILSQLNRGLLSRLQEKSNEPAVRRDDIFQSDTIYHVSDYMYALQNAHYLGIEEYRSLYPDNYTHLQDRFTDPNSKGKISLITEGCIFVEILKDRDAEVNSVDLYTIELYKPEKKESSAMIPNFSKPKQTEENPFKGVTPEFNLNNAFDTEENTNEKTPF